eukprot:scaffold25103_cov113-Cylindrotheca_fusiformis.AAC.2
MTCSTYAQDCAVGIGGYMSVIAIIFYLVAQTISCCGPRPEPLLAGLFASSFAPRIQTKRKKTRKKRSYSQPGSSLSA